MTSQVQDLCRANRTRLRRHQYRALVLVDLAERRWRCGLRALAADVYKERDEPSMAALLRRGFVADTPDDDAWVYVLTITPLGRVLLNADRARAAAIRRELYATRVCHDEVACVVD